MKRQRRRSTSTGAAVIAAFVSLLLSGCGTATLVPVHGSVKNEGQVVSGGSVVFMPVGEGKSAFGPIQPDGTFQLTTFSPNDGALIGQYRVSVAGERDPQTERTSPTYIGPSELLFDVAAGSENRFQIDIRKRDGWQAAVGG
jgi:hypothetical protein